MLGHVSTSRGFWKLKVFLPKLLSTGPLPPPYVKSCLPTCNCLKWVQTQHHNCRWWHSLLDTRCLMMRSISLWQHADTSVQSGLFILPGVNCSSLFSPTLRWPGIKWRRWWQQGGSKQGPPSGHKVGPLPRDSPIRGQHKRSRDRGKSSNATNVRQLLAKILLQLPKPRSYCYCLLILTAKYRIDMFLYWI